MDPTEARKRCYEHRMKMKSLAKEKKWDQLVLNPYHEWCPQYQRGYCPDVTMMYLLSASPFTEEIETHLIRLYGNQTKEDWLRLIYDMSPSVDTIRYLLDKGYIDVNDTYEDYTLFNVIFARYDYGLSPFPLLEYFLSKGVDMNGMSVGGKTVLHHAILFYYELNAENQDPMDMLRQTFRSMLEWGTDPMDMLRQILRNLLEWGADPLLEDKEGESPLKLAQLLETRVSEEDPPRDNYMTPIIALLNEYA